MITEYPKDKRPYPLCKNYGWEGPIRWPYKTITDFLKKLARQSVDGPRRKALRATLNALEAIHARREPNAMYTGDKVKELLVLAADECGWYQTVVMPKEKHHPGVPEHHKICAKCGEVKHLSAFVAVATAKQKEKFGWRVDAKRTVTHKLCDVCRPLRLKRQRYLEEKRQEKANLSPEVKRKDPALYVLALYEKSIKTHYQRIHTTFHKHKVTIDTETGPVSEHRFTHDEDRAFYEEKRRLIMLSKARLAAAVAQGTVADLPEHGEWQALLTHDEREGLHHLWTQGSWNGMHVKRAPPRIFD